MFYLSLVNQIHFLFIICISLSIIVISALLYSHHSFLSIQGASFVTPFSLIIASFISINEIKSEAFIDIAQISVLFLFLIFTAFKINKRFNRLILFSQILLPAVLIILLEYNESIPNNIVTAGVYSAFIAAGALSNMFFLRKEKGNKAILFWAMLLLLTGALLELSGHSNLITYASLTFDTAAFTAFFLYFYKEAYFLLSEKISNAEKKVSDINKNVNLEVKRRMFDMERSHEKLVNISKTDPLTKSLNKAAIFEKIELMITSGSTREFSILMFDIDKFKTVNDTLGHIMGDKCIKKLALIAGNCIRDIDFLGRFGGDEFIIILPGVSVPQARLIAERFRKKVEETDSPHFTISIGISAFPKDADTLKGLISVADDGLYISKQNGRNAVSYKGGPIT